MWVSMVIGHWKLVIGNGPFTIDEAGTEDKSKTQIPTV
jgi:hypothetical protein